MSTSESSPNATAAENCANKVVLNEIVPYESKGEKGKYRNQMGTMQNNA